MAVFFEAGASVVFAGDGFGEAAALLLPGARASLSLAGEGVFFGPRLSVATRLALVPPL